MATGGGFNFGGFGAKKTTATTGFAFSTPAATSAPSLGFSFGAKMADSTPVGGTTGASTSTPAAGGFPVGGGTGVATSGAGGAASSTGFSLGLQAPASTTGWAAALPQGAATKPAQIQQHAGLPVGAATQPAPTQPTQSTTGTFGGLGTATTKAPTLTLGSAAPAATGLSITGGTSGSGFRLGGLPTTQTTSTTTSSGLTLGGITAGVKPGISASSATPGFPLAGTSTASTTTGTSTTGAAAGIGFGQQATTGGVKLGTSTASTAATLSTTTSTTAATQAAPSMNYRQLEEAINKWTLELEEQERIFLTQATKVNAWDRMLIDNGEKITQLNSDVERVKIDQQRLDHELDFILAQQKELEDMLTPLEKSMEQLPPINYQQHADMEREYTYQLAENVDAQLKRMVQDLKEIIEHLNASGSNPDSSDPIHQVAKILNAHMDSLQWIDQNTGVLQRRVDEVAKLAESKRKEQERNFRLAYD